MSGIYDITLAPGATGQILAIGTRAKVIAAPGGLVSVRLGSGEAYTLLEGQGVRFPEGRQFSGISVKNLAAIAQTVLVFVGDSNFEDTRITGSVNVIDQSVQKTRLGLQFMNSVANGVSAGFVSVVGIYNPSANTRSVSLKKVIVSSAIAGMLYFIKGTLPGTAYGANSVATGNKLITGAASAAHMFSGYTVAVNPTPAEAPSSSLWVAFYVAANTPFLFPLDVPVVMSPGDLFYLSGGVVNRDVSAVFDFEEVT